MPRRNKKTRPNPPNSPSDQLLNLPLNQPDYQYRPYDRQCKGSYNLPYHESNGPSGSNNQLGFGPGYSQYQLPYYQHNSYDQQVTSMHDLSLVQAQTPVGNGPWDGSGLDQSPRRRRSLFLRCLHQYLNQRISQCAQQCLNSGFRESI